MHIWTQMMPLRVQMVHMNMQTLLMNALIRLPGRLLASGGKKLFRERPSRRAQFLDFPKLLFIPFS
jgi:hypothetical protein